jgi:hypothetical protein
MPVRKVSSLISDKTTAAPAWAKARAVASPMAELAPVTSATSPVKSCVGFTAVSLPWMEVVQAGGQQAAGGGRGLRSRIPASSGASGAGTPRARLPVFRAAGVARVRVLSQTAGGECSPWGIESTLRILADDWELVVAAKGQSDE